MKYLKVWTSFREVIGTLADDEKGRLFDMMLLYAEQGREPDVFPGNERFIWPVAKRDIDLANEFNQKQRENGKKGGRPAGSKADKTQNNPIEPNETQNNPIEPNKTLKVKERKEKESKEKESFFSDSEAADIQREHDQVLEAALNAGFKSSPAERAGLLNLYAEHGLEKMLSGINECVTHSAPNLAYLGAVLKGTPKKKSDARDVHGYEQRDYSGEQQAALRRMMSDEWGSEGGVG